MELKLVPVAIPENANVIISNLGRGILGMIDGSSPKGVEEDADREWRVGFLRKIGYKR